MRIKFSITCTMTQSDKLSILNLDVFSNTDWIQSQVQFLLVSKTIKKCTCLRNLLMNSYFFAFYINCSLRMKSFFAYLLSPAFARIRGVGAVRRLRKGDILLFGSLRAFILAMTVKNRLYFEGSRS